MTQPGVAIRGLFEKETLTELEVEEFIKQDLRWYDIRSGTLNNWDSIFLYGLLNSPGVLSFITRHHNQSFENGGEPF